MAYMMIKPTDTLFFRSGKPFDAGADSWSDSSFLPNPSVIWGAMFSALLLDGKVTVENKKSLEIKNIYLYNEKQTTVLIPAPLDIFVDDDDNYYTAKHKDADFLSNYPLTITSVANTDKEVKPLEKCFIEINSLYEHYTHGYDKNLILYSFEDVFAADYKVGIKINKNTKTADEGHLYRVDLTQFRADWSFLVEYECDKQFCDSGILKLGGEGKTASYQTLGDEPIGLKSAETTKKRMRETLKTSEYFKVFFKTPVYFEDGWRPKQSGLLCANVGKYISIGGWDMEKGVAKAMRRYAPAGSVYVFEKRAGEEPNFEAEDDETYKGFGGFEILSI